MWGGNGFDKHHMRDTVSQSTPSQSSNIYFTIIFVFEPCIEPL